MEATLYCSTLQDKESKLAKIKNQIKREIEEEERRLKKEKEGSIK